MGVFGKANEGAARLSSLLAMRAESANFDAPVRTKRLSSRPNPRELGVKAARVEEGTSQLGDNQKWPIVAYLGVFAEPGSSRSLAPCWVVSRGVWLKGVGKRAWVLAT